MTLVMKWDGLNLPDQNVVVGLKGPLDTPISRVSATKIAKYRTYGSAPKSIVYTGPGGITDSKSGKNPGFTWSGIANIPGVGGNLLGTKQWQVAFYFKGGPKLAAVKGNKSYATNPSPFDIFRAFSVDSGSTTVCGLYIDPITYDLKFNVKTSSTAYTTKIIRTDFASASDVDTWWRMEVSFNRDGNNNSGVVATRIGTDTNPGTWIYVNMNDYVRAWDGLRTIVFFRDPDTTDKRMWEPFTHYQIRNVSVNDEGKNLPIYTAPIPVTVSRSPSGTISITDGGSFTCTGTTTTGTAAITSKGWTFVDDQGGNTTPPVGATISSTSTTLSVSNLPFIDLGTDFYWYRFKYSATDANNYTASTYLTVTVGAPPPNPPDFVLAGTSIYSGQSAVINAMPVVGSDIESWDITLDNSSSGDTVVTVEPIVSTRKITVGPFPTAGTYTITVVATSSNGLSAEKTAAIIVTDPTLPVITLDEPLSDITTVYEGDIISLKTSVTAGTFDITPTMFIVNPSGYETITSTGTNSADIKFNAAGIYQITASVTDLSDNTVLADKTKVADIQQLVLPSVVFPDITNIDLNHTTEAWITFETYAGTKAIDTVTVNVFSSPENVGFTVGVPELVDPLLSDHNWKVRVSDFPAVGDYAILVTVTDTSGNSNPDPYVFNVYDDEIPVTPVIPTDPYSYFSNVQMAQLAARRLSEVDKEALKQNLRTYYLSVIDEPSKYDFSFHQAEWWFMRYVAEGKIDNVLGLFGVIDGGDSNREDDM